MSDELVKVASTADIPDQMVKVVVVSGKRIAICHADGEFYAIADLCTHDNGPLGEGQLEGNEIECPRHGARFDVRTGKVTCLPAVMPVPTYKLEVRDGAIYVGV
jgi:3-phenylpropionate/trans-cinnamate dioxygenase ferredoxin subunit